MKLLKPINLNLEKMIDDEKYYMYLTNNQGKLTQTIKTGKVIKKIFPQIYYFINKIILTEEEKGNYYKKTYKRITSKNVSDVISYNKLRQIVFFLTKLNIIKCKRFGEIIQVGYESYNVDVRHYKLTDIYNNAPTEIIDAPIKRKKRVVVNSYTKKLIADDPVYQHMHEKCSNYKFDVDFASRAINEFFYDKLLSKEQFVSYHLYIARLRNRDIHFNVSAKTGRVTTLINMCPRILRGLFYRSDKQKGCELDFQTFNVHTLIKLIHDYLKTKTVSPSLAKELCQITEYSKNDFYSHVVELFNQQGCDIDRDDAKEIVLWKWINAKIDNNYFEYKIMSKIFPETTKIIKLLKGDNEMDYKNYCIRFMQIEADLVYRIYKKFIASYPDCKLYTVYDCFLVDNKFTNHLKEIMFQEAKAFFEKEIIVKEELK